MNAGPLLYDEVMELDLGIVYSCPPEEAVPHILAYFQQEFSNIFNFYFPLCNFLACFSYLFCQFASVTRLHN